MKQICELNDKIILGTDGMSTKAPRLTARAIVKNQDGLYAVILEVAIVQSCRAVEAIIGEPPNRKKESKVAKHKQHWIDTVGIDPDSQFTKAGKSYLDFYYELFFDLRNPSAHSYGNIHFELKRKRAVEAQCFAAIILRDYITTHMLDHDAAIERLKFNKSLLDRVSSKK